MNEFTLDRFAFVFEIEVAKKSQTEGQVKNEIKDRDHIGKGVEFSVDTKPMQFYNQFSKVEAQLFHPEQLSLP